MTFHLLFPSDGRYAEATAPSRLQRDLSDSTVRRTFGAAPGHTLRAWNNLTRGLRHVSPDEKNIRSDLHADWEAVSEGAQTILRAAGKPDAYKSLKQVTRGRVLTKADDESWRNSIDIDDRTRARLKRTLGWQLN